MSELRECAEGLCDVFGISLDQEGDAAGSELWSAVMGLREIVGVLPLYADTGEPFIPGSSDAWTIANGPMDDNGVYPVLAGVHNDNGAGWAWVITPHGHTARCDAYSTEEAAKAAKEKGGGDA